MTKLEIELLATAGDPRKMANGIAQLQAEIESLQRERGECLAILRKCPRPEAARPETLVEYLQLVVDASSGSIELLTEKLGLAEAKCAELARGYRHLGEVAMSCKQVNTPDWMSYLMETISEADAILDAPNPGQRLLDENAALKDRVERLERELQEIAEADDDVSAWHLIASAKEALAACEPKEESNG